MADGTGSYLSVLREFQAVDAETRRISEEESKARAALLDAEKRHRESSGRWVKAFDALRRTLEDADVG